MLSVYLAGEIHSNWREEIIQLCEKEKLDIKFTSPITDHEASDNCGVEILGVEEKNFWKDRKGANINSIRTKKSIQDCDVIIVKFGEKFKQWNAAFDARLTPRSSSRFWKPAPRWQRRCCGASFRRRGSYANILSGSVDAVRGSALLTFCSS